MYNKIFNKIVDSSIWMEPDNVRIVFLMFIAIMDEDGFVNLAGEKNVAHRAIMGLDAASAALRVLEAPDPDSSNPANEGRRIERVDGGWMVLNAPEYRNLVKREHQKELNRERVRKHREKTQCNAPVMGGNDPVTPSEANALANSIEGVAIAPPSVPPPGKPGPKPKKNQDSIAWNGSGWDGISDQDRADWKAAYPACDIDRQLAAAHQWLLSNPDKSHKKRWRRFLTGWLTRSQERGGDVASNRPAKPDHRAEKAAREYAQPQEPIPFI